jgi:hypothetical protein
MSKRKRKKFEYKHLKKEFNNGRSIGGKITPT